MCANLEPRTSKLPGVTSGHCSDSPSLPARYAGNGPYVLGRNTTEVCSMIAAPVLPGAVAITEVTAEHPFDATAKLIIANARVMCGAYKKSAELYARSHAVEWCRDGQRVRITGQLKQVT